ncbi:hypothetical protein [Sphingobium phenoxybenzoativorans]|uniref:hypothetical protein n=1 Tax=Sphingobium phenoxybenzoativorans TaxID=1592790 RepID=UPI000871CF1C|nr:hypothetical protein [Sphingobium phenoxybenzoativorans]
MRDTELAEAFLSNAYGFLKADLASLAISLELGLKSYLLHRGYADEWNSHHIRHDLRMAYDIAVEEEFGGVTPALEALIDAFSPIYSELHLDRCLLAAEAPLIMIAREATCSMLDEISAAIHQ